MTSIVEALSGVMAEVRAVGKDGYNQGQKFRFRGVDAVMNAVGPAFRKHKVVCIPEVLEHSMVGKTTSKGSSMTFVNVKVRYHLHGPDGDSISGVVVAESFDSGDKGTAKAMSVAYRTFLLQALCLPTDDPEPDQDVYEDVRPAERPAGPQATNHPRAAQQAASEPQDAEVLAAWRSHYQKAVAQGPQAVKAFEKWARQNDAPPVVVEAAQQWIQQHQPEKENQP